MHKIRTERGDVMTKRIALLYGGASSEHDVSVMGYEYVSSLLRNTKYEIIPIYIGKNGEWSYRLADSDVKVYPVAENGGGLHTERGFIKIDAAIPLLHGDGGEDGTVQGALECAKIPYVGADVTASAICLDKAYTKIIAHSLGIPTVKGVTPSVDSSTEEALRLCCEELSFPMFIKPRRLGSSVGAYPLCDADDFKHFYPLSKDAGRGLVTVEKCLTDKRELECAFIQLGGKKAVTPPGEILIEDFYGYEEKYGGSTKLAIHADIDRKTEDRIIKYAKILADAVNLRHLGRIDFFLSGEEIFFNEINTFPGFTKESLYPKLIQEYGINPKDALISFIDEAVSW